RANIKDVANRAGVHPSTVSRVLNPATRSMVSESLAEKIICIANELGYRRNPLASGLRTQRTFTVGIIIPDLTNPVFPPIVRGVEHTLDSEGYIAILADSGSKRRSEQALIENMKAHQVDGLILAAATRKDPLVDQCIDQGIPLVLVNRTVDKHNVAAVINDDELGIDLAVAHLVELGHEKIAYIGGPQRTSTGYTRYRAFLKTIKKARISIDRALVVNAREFSEQSGQALFRELVATGRKFTAVVTANDLLALGCCDAMTELGLSCPKDISITGFNDMPYIDRFVPPLTTLHIPHDELGVQAALLLLERIQNPDTPAKQLRLEPRMIVRGSTAVPSSTT
ncbi:MAG TPA: LacI family transcriptional regulator, partial [Planctomycetes bacterium]|nr:LacI family transcriptional regulator [Planctomycetota bacterium]